jgi:uncharacterized protein Yka (UPF0111/DUF47 family)
MKRRWFLPETPDMIGMLCGQAEATIDGMDTLVAWANGEAGAADKVRDLEHAADREKWTLRRALTETFTAPIDAEDLYVMSERLDAVMNGARDAVRESEVMALPPDAALAEMAGLFAQGVRHLAEAFRLLSSKERRGEEDAATAAATAAIRSQREVEGVYRSAMSSLLGVEDLREVMAKRELYRRFSRISEDLTEAADRVWYATVKEA